MSPLIEQYWSRETRKGQSMPIRRHSGKGLPKKSREFNVKAGEKNRTGLVGEDFGLSSENIQSNLCQELYHT